MNKLGKLEKVNLRDIWSNEEYDFSIWLSKEENLKEKHYHNIGMISLWEVQNITFH